MNFKRFKTLAITAIFAAAAHSALPQTSGVGNITGTVTDTSGAVVPGASVVVIDTDTGVTRNLTTNGAGEYNASFLQPGHYEVILGGGSFGKVDRKNLLLTVGQTLSIDAALSAGSVATQVEVTSAAPLVDTDKTEVSQTIGAALIANLPIASRNWSAFVLNTPNVTQDGGSGLVSFHGISGLYNQNYVDGSNNNQMLFSEARGRASGAPYVYSIDSIKEFQAETSNYSVEFGQAAGGQVNAITKSGTNQFHGDAFYYLRYPTLNALDPYSKFQALHNGATPFLLTQPVHQQQQFGGSIGGPIIKDRLFFFFTYDGFRKVGRALYSDTNYISLTPSAVVAPPAGTSATTLVTPTQCPATITAAQCNNGIAFLLNVANIAPGQTPPSRFQKQNLFFPRLDAHINSRNDAFVDYNFADYDSSYGYSPAPTFSNSSPSTNGPTSYHERFLVAGLTTQIGKSSVNQVHFQYGRDLETAGAYASGPSVATGVVTFGMPNALPRVAEPDEHRTQFTDVFSTTKGHHTLKFGGDVNLVHEVMINLFQGGGVYSYGDSTPTLNFQDWIQDAFAGQAGNTDPYAGYHYNTFVQTIDIVNTAPGTQGKDDFWMKMFDGFAEDTWRVTPNLTLTVGLRYDIQLTPAPGLVNNNFAPISTQYSGTIKNVTDRVQPRIGFSWTPYGGSGTVVRGGYGMFSALNQGSTYYAMRVENGVVQVNYNYTGCQSSVGAPTTANPKPRCTTVPSASNSLQYPLVPFPVTGPPLSSALFPTGGTAPSVNGPAILGSQSFHGLDPNFVPPLAHEADLSVEQALPGKMTLSVGYVGTRALRLPVFVDANLIGQTPHGTASYNVTDSSNKVIKQLTVPVYLQSDRRSSAITSINTGFSIANTWYNSLAATVRRPFSNGLEVLANYTWARATDTGQVQGTNGTFYGGDTPLDPNNVRRDNGPSDTDIRNRFTLSFVYKPQIFEGNKIVKHLVDDFTFSGGFIASGGQPIFLGMSGTVYSGTGTSYGADGNIYGGAMSSSSGSATTGRPPQIGRNSIYGPGFNNFDFRVARDIPIYRRMYMQVTADAFNLLNHTIITGVNGTYSQYLASGSSSGTLKCNVTSAPTGSTFQGCIAPYSGTGLSAFGAPSGTNNSLYGPRQMQFAAKLFF
ncbi:TonB-dependent receptor [Granulicella sp. WH15]|uniref:TonB-dependent receptor n=1 Tax=Granulicella sp. WH15 TaxID=2602070 RepID=UPI001366F2C3|nr:TonB-dependent receptor [Granulicella sp. WH15]QHN04935.1 TonB-dependent receptor [Granulicella sp. WH15]